MGKQYFWGYFSYVLLERKLENLFRFSFSGTRNIIFGTLKIGQNDPEIPNLEFESHGFLQNHVFLPTEQAETNICWIIYQDATFEICLSLFGWKENILPKQHIVQCATAYIAGMICFALMKQRQLTTNNSPAGKCEVTVYNEVDKTKVWQCTRSIAIKKLD